MRTAERDMPTARPSRLDLRGVQVEPRPLSLRRNFSWTMAGTLVYAGCQWAMLAALAKVGSAEMVGQFALGLAVTGPIMLFANLQLSALQATDATGTYRFGHYLTLRLVTTGLALAAIAALAFGVGFGLATVGAILGVGAGKAFEALSDAYHGLMQLHGRFDRVAKSQLLKGPLSVLALVAVVALSGNVVWGIAALAAAWGLLLVVYDCRSVTWLRSTIGDPQAAILDPQAAQLHWDWSVLRQLAWLALPLGLVAVLFNLSSNIPRYFVERQLGEAQLGIFAALAYVGMFAQLVSNALGQAAAPRLARLYAAGDLRGFRVLVLKLVAVGATVGGAGVLLAVVAGRPVLTLLYRAEYAEHTGIFVTVMAGATLWCMATMFIYAATASRRNRSQAVAAAVVALAALAASALLIQGDSLAGAAAATVASATAALVAFGAIFLTTGKQAPSVSA